MATKPKTTGAPSLLDQYKAGKVLTLQQQTLATAGMTSAEKYTIAQVRGNAIQTARANAAPVPSSAPSTKPNVTPTATSGATPPVTPPATPASTTSSGAGGYGKDLANSYNTSSTTTVPMNVGGVMKNVPISEALKLAQGGNPGLSTVIQSLRAKGQISKTTNKMADIAKAWSLNVNAAARAGQNPFDYLNMLPDPPSSTNVAKDGTTTYATDYSGSKGQSAFQSAFQNVFGRAPVAGDQLSPLKDSKGNPITWVQALANEGNKPGNAETVTRSGQGKYVVTKGGFDAQAWIQGQLADYYRSGIKAGKLAPEQNVATKYSNLASDYGIDIYNPQTKAFNTSALNDLANLESKVTTLDTLKQGWSNSIIAAHPSLATQMGAGLTLRQAADPALKSISNILGIDPNGITLNDPLVQKYLTGDGKSIMPQYQYEQTLRQDPRWATSKDAQDNLSAVAMSMAKTFGVMG